VSGAENCNGNDSLGFVVSAARTLWAYVAVGLSNFFHATRMRRPSQGRMSTLNVLFNWELFVAKVKSVGVDRFYFSKPSF